MSPFETIGLGEQLIGSALISEFTVLGTVHLRPLLLLLRFGLLSFSKAVAMQWPCNSTRHHPTSLPDPPKSSCIVMYSETASTISGPEGWDSASQARLNFKQTREISNSCTDCKTIQNSFLKDFRHFVVCITLEQSPRRIRKWAGTIKSQLFAYAVSSVYMIQACKVPPPPPQPPSVVVDVGGV